MDSKTVREKHKQFLFPATANYYDESIVLAEGKGSRLTDLDGKSYLDFFGGILTVSVGHANDKVNAAVIAQIQRLNHVSTLYPTVPIVELAETLARITPGRLSKSYFVTSGTEADETAVMMAQLYTKSTELIALRHGYSGRSLLAQSLTAHSMYRAVPTQVAAVKHALAPYCYRCPLKLDAKSCAAECAEDVEELIRTTTTGRIAGMIVEPVLGVGGFIAPPAKYFQIASQIVRNYGGVMIVDEVQTGFGRTGKMWGSEQIGIEPDIMTMAKGIANGFPIAATICLPEIADTLQKGTISTFGGNPVSTTAALATIAVIEEEKLVENSATQGARLRAGLVKLKEAHPKTIGDVRGLGLMQAMELVTDETKKDRTPNAVATVRFMEECKKRGLLVGKGGLYGNALRIAPALNVTGADVDEALGVMGEAFAAMNA
jgi:alanine-glyoxylate transaminase/(R)-3-amino-2-methylpropionate-pyruvate transaminase